MDRVESPESRQAMLQYVPEVERVVEQQHRQRCLQPRGEPESLQDSQTAALYEPRKWNRDRSLRELENRGTYPRYSQIAREAPAFWFHWITKTLPFLQQEQQTECGG